MAKIRNYWMMVRIEEDRMGNLTGSPESEKWQSYFDKNWGTHEAFAQEGFVLWYDIFDSLSKQAQKDIQSGWGATVRMPIDQFENWIAYHNPH